MEVDALGLDEVDHRLVRMIAEKYGGGPVGLDTLAASTGEEADTIMDVYEPYLMQLGFLNRTPRGRMLTRAAYEHFGLTPPPRLGRRTAAAVGQHGRSERDAPEGDAMLTTADNELLTRVGPGTPGGELMRRYWHPIAASAAVGREPLSAR